MFQHQCFLFAKAEISAGSIQKLYTLHDMPLEDKDLRALCTKVLSENKERLLYYPAASKNHHAEYGGLLYHEKKL